MNTIGPKCLTISLIFIILNIPVFKVSSQPIIADHTIVAKYQDIPQYYIDEVKKIWISIAGESHSVAYRTGCSLLEQIDSRFNVNVIECGDPESYTNQHLRINRATWGDVDNESGWIYDYGEEDWFTSELAISRTKAGITYCNTHDLILTAIGLGWCWDPSINFTDYISASDEYSAYCQSMGYSTKVIFTTGTVDSYTGEAGYIKHLGYESIRDHVKNSDRLILFDYADILCYNGDGSTNSATWNDHTYPIITDENLGDGSIGHISSAGALRLGKAIWWMLARISGWNGLPEGDDIETPTTPINLQCITLSNSSAQLTWDASSDNIGVTGYKIYRDGIVIDSTTELTFTDNGLSAGNNYSYYITAYDAAWNESPQSATILISTENTAIGSQVYQLNIFPNPNSGTFEIYIQENDGQHLFQLYSIEGILLVNRIVQIKDSGTKMEDNQLKAGIYFIKISNYKHIYSAKILVVK
jgi:hypothetical protein